MKLSRASRHFDQHRRVNLNTPCNPLEHTETCYWQTLHVPTSPQRTPPWRHSVSLLETQLLFVFTFTRRASIALATWNNRIQYSSLHLSLANSGVSAWSFIWHIHQSTKLVVTWEDELALYLIERRKWQVMSIRNTLYTNEPNATEGIDCKSYTLSLVFVLHAVRSGLDFWRMDRFSVSSRYCVIISASDIYLYTCQVPKTYWLLQGLVYYHYLIWPCKSIYQVMLY